MCLAPRYRNGPIAGPSIDWTKAASRFDTPWASTVSGSSTATSTSVASSNRMEGLWYDYKVLAQIGDLRDAIRDLVRDGDVVALEGFTHLIPFAAGHEPIRQNRRNLTLVRMTPDVIYDQLIGAGCARKLVFSWGGNPGVGSLHRLRDAVENAWPAPLEIEEHEHAGMAVAYAAGASHVPCGILRGYRGTELA